MASSSSISGFSMPLLSDSSEDPEDQSLPCDIEWRDITYTIPSSKVGDSDTPKVVTSSGGQFRYILRGVSGKVEAGQMLAVLGPSGAGKTSLLNALAGRVPAKTRGSVLTGKILINGVDINNINMATLAAYVMQNDALFALSTVRESLMFAAELRLPAYVSREYKALRVNEIISLLGLNEAADTFVGDDKIRGISGGERKRVSIGVDLLHKPKLIFCDEPSSGLDSFQAQSVMKALSDIAQQGCTVICSIHQPRSSIFSMLDLLCLLAAGGRTVYFGQASEAETYFAMIGHEVPNAFNPSDFFLDLISVDYRTQHDMERTMKVVDRVVESFFEHETQSAELKAESSAVPESSLNLLQNSAAMEVPAPKLHSCHEQFWKPFVLLLKRQWREQTRNKTALAIKYTLNTFFAAVFGTVYFQLAHDQTSIQDRTGILFFICLNQAFGSAIGVAQVIPAQLQVVNRERVSGLYGALPFYVATFLVSLPLEVVPQVAYGSVIYYMTGLRPGFNRFLVYIGVMVSENFCGIGLGMLLSVLLEEPEMAGVIAPVVVIFFLVFSGYFLNEDSLPSPIAWMKYTSFIRYAFQALCVNEFKNADFSCDYDDGQALDDESACGCLSGNDKLKELNFENVVIWENEAALLSTIAGFNIMACLVLEFWGAQFMRIRS